jgi:ABC-type branched-subunit amino acid transport system substrate-binding protein
VAVEVNLADDESIPDQAAAVAADFIAAGYTYLIGPYSTGLTRAVIAATEAASTPSRPVVLVAGSASECLRLP